MRLLVMLAVVLGFLVLGMPVETASAAPASAPAASTFDLAQPQQSLIEEARHRRSGYCHRHKRCGYKWRCWRHHGHTRCGWRWACSSRCHWHRHGVVIRLF